MTTRSRWNGEALSAAREALLRERRAGGADPACESQVREIIARVRAGGDRTLSELAQRFDGVAPSALAVPAATLVAARDALEPGVRRALEHAARNLERAHEAFRPCAVEVETEPGVRVGRRPDPLARVGVYAPGGRAAYASSVLMACIPARVAGVAQIVVCSPPQRGTGLPSDVVMAAAHLAGATEVVTAGGAGAIAALAYGTESLAPVERIVGPGNAWVAEAKRQVAGVVGIDSPAGPSELLVIADDAADADGIARELLAQAEHDPEAVAIAVAIGPRIAAAMQTALERALAGAPSGAYAAALVRRGGVVRADDAGEALAFANAFAPEHLLLALSAPEATLAEVRGAGAVFVGATSSVVFGDYLAGGNHVLPTGGAARACSGLSTLDFVRWTAWQRVSEAGAAALAGDAGALAEAEGLPAHAAAARAWAGAVR